MSRRSDHDHPQAIDLSPGAIADRVDAAMGRADQRLVELGVLPPKRTRAEKRARRAGRRLPNDAVAGETADQRKARRKAQARSKRKARR